MINGFIPMRDEAVLTGIIKISVRADLKVISLIRNYTNALRYVVNEILKHPEKYGVFKFSKEEKRIKWKQRKIQYIKTFMNK